MPTLYLRIVIAQSRAKEGNEEDFLCMVQKSWLYWRLRMHQQARESWNDFSFLFVPARMKDTCVSVSLLSWGVVPAVSVRVCICPNEGSASQVHLILDSMCMWQLPTMAITDNFKYFQYLFLRVICLFAYCCHSLIFLTCSSHVLSLWTGAHFLFNTFFESVNWAFICCLSWTISSF